MKFKDLYVDMGIIKDNTEIFIRKGLQLLARGCWFQDDVLEYQDKEIESFTWQDDNTVIIRIKEGDE